MTRSLLVLGVLAWAAIAQANVIVLSEMREISGEAETIFDSESTDHHSFSERLPVENLWIAQDFAVASVISSFASASAEQHSWVNLTEGLSSSFIAFPSGASAEGNTFDSEHRAESASRSLYPVLFELTAPYNYELNANVAAFYRSLSNDGGYAKALVFLTGPDGTVADVEVIADAQTGRLSDNDSVHKIGTLGPGVYLFQMVAQAHANVGINGSVDASHEARFDAFLTLTPTREPSPPIIPEPTSMLLVGTGLFLMARKYFA